MSARNAARSAGVLMPIFSLPSPFGVGTLGRQAREFADFLAQAGQSYWQILPIGPTGYGDSPYQSFSSRAGNPYFIDLDELEKQGLLEREEYASLPWGDDPERVDYQALYRLRLPVLRLACDRLLSRRSAGFARFCRAHGAWLDDYALFMALKEQYGGAPWLEWPEDVRLRRPQALERAKRELKGEMRFWQGVQYLFFRQWHKFKTYVNEKGISIVGDLPIYVSGDSADVWAAPDQFQLDENGYPTLRAGCPPDYFTPEGQDWGNPLYDWETMKQDGYQWWIRRVRRALTQFDFVRMDHFRGFAAYYAIPAGQTAKSGYWMKGPGVDLFRALAKQLGRLPILAEDLGALDSQVTVLLRHTGLAGMNVWQFNAEEMAGMTPEEAARRVFFSGTHDNQTLRGFLEESGDDRSAKDILNALLESPAAAVILPVQDVLGLGDEARINVPGVPTGNWKWSMTWEQLEQLKTGGIL